MSLRTDILPVVDELRGLAGPSNFDVRTTRLTIRTRVWSGGRRGSGVSQDTDLVLPQIYKVVLLTTKEIAGSGGRYEMGDVRIGPITPASTSGGFTSEQLKPSGAQGTEIIYVLTGAVTGEYALVSLNTDKPFGYYLVIRKMRTTP